jgi:hypothetical protein
MVITQKSLYITLFVIGTLRLSIPLRLARSPARRQLSAYREFADDVGLPLLYLGSPVSTFFWLVGSSAILILGHACLMEPGLESEYGNVETV